VNIATSARAAVGVLALTIAIRPVQGQQPPQPQQPAVSVPRAVLERYVGEYLYPTGSLVLIRLRGDTLIREMNGQQDVYTPLSETRFKAGNTQLVADFVTDQAGVVTQILKPGGGRGGLPEIRLARLSAGSVPKAVLERYVGDYQFLPRLTIAVRVEGQILVGQLPGGPQTVLVPVSETRFTVGTGNNQMDVEFVTDKAGAVTKVVRQGAYELRATRKPKS
jgi:hypothetical protein